MSEQAFKNKPSLKETVLLRANVSGVYALGEDHLGIIALAIEQKFAELALEHGLCEEGHERDTARMALRCLDSRLGGRPVDPDSGQASVSRGKKRPPQMGPWRISTRGSAAEAVLLKAYSNGSGEILHRYAFIVGKVVTSFSPNGNPNSGTLQFQIGR
jgi:hypothetical protein